MEMVSVNLTTINLVRLIILNGKNMNFLKTSFQKISKGSQKDLYVMILATSLASGITLLTQALISKIVSPEIFGEIRLIYGYFLMIYPIIMFGLHPVLGRLCIQENAKPRWASYWTFLKNYWVLPSIILTLIFATLAASGKLTELSSLNKALAILLLSMPVWVQSEFYQFFWKFTRERQRASIAIIIARICFLGGSVTGLILLTPSSSGFAKGFLIGGLICLVILWLMNRAFLKKIPPANKPIKLTTKEKQIVSNVWPMAIILNMIAGVSVQLDTLMLDYMIANTHTAGLYGFAFIFANAALLIQTPLLAYLLPELGHYYDQSKKLFLQKVIIYQIALTSFIALICILIEIVIPIIIPYIFDFAYYEALALLPLMLIRSIALSSSSVFSEALFVMNKLNIDIQLRIINIISTVLLSWLWIPDHGVIGLIYARIIADIIQFIMYLTIVLYIGQKNSQVVSQEE